MALNAYYDTRIAPVTFDFVYFLINAECHRQAARLPEIDLNIICAGFRNQSLRDQKYAESEKAWRVHHIIGQIPRLLPTVRATKFQYDEISHVSFPAYPKTYPFLTQDSAVRSYMPTVFRRMQEEGCQVQPFEATTHAKNLVRNYTRGHPYITISLRTTEFQPERNSNLDAWYNFSLEMGASGVRVLVIPDFEDSFNNRAAWKYDWDLVDFAAHDLDLRLALYEDAVDNFTVNNGVAALLVFSKCPFKMFKMSVPGIETTSAEYLKSNWNVDPGETPSFLQGDQRWVWQDDAVENLMEFARAT
ncbi:MAG: hypothetical protein OSB02_12250 [Rhodospirillaceae bacterium]|nr:hypothetical protein [Rhodospirillaceae bacterium]